MARGTLLGNEDVLGVKVGIYVDRSGRFNARMADGNGEDDAVHEADTKDGLLDKLKAAIRKSRQAILIPVTLFDYGPKTGRWGPNERGTVDCFLRGVHSRTQDFLMQDLKGQKFTVDDYVGGKRLARRFTPDQAERYQTLAAAADNAAAALEAFVNEIKVTPEVLLSEQAKAAGQATDAGDQDANQPADL